MECLAHGRHSKTLYNERRTWISPDARRKNVRKQRFECKKNENLQKPGPGLVREVVRWRMMRAQKKEPERLLLRKPIRISRRPADGELPTLRSRWLSFIVWIQPNGLGGSTQFSNNCKWISSSCGELHSNQLVLNCQPRTILLSLGNGDFCLCHPTLAFSLRSSLHGGCSPLCILDRGGNPHCFKRIVSELVWPLVSSLRWIWFPLRSRWGYFS